VIPLDVAGAFHTAHMAPAVAELAARAAAVEPADPRITLLSNADGTAVTDGAQALARLVAQVANPVRWDLCQRTMQQLGVTGVLELAPAGVLSGLARRTLPGVETVAVKSPADLGAARDLVRRHGGTTPRTPDSQEIPS
jgi:[acyl-carrier-protein] S-malonyltransferase